VAAAVLCLLLAAACTSGPDVPELDRLDAPTETPPVDVPAETAAPSPSDLSGLTGRLAVIDAARTLSTMAPDGSDVVVLAESERGRTLVRQPAWAPDGSRLAWVDLEADGDEVVGAVATASPDGSRASEHPTAVAPFYLSWDPTSSRVAYLGSSAPGEIGFGVVEVAGARRGTPLENGQPFYLSWAPDGERLLVHVGEDRLETLGLDGSLTTVAERPGLFRAPVWTADGRTFVYATRRDDGTQRLVVHGVDHRRGESLLAFDGLLTFVVSPDGDRIAYQIIEQDGSAPLRVTDMTGRQTVEITDEPTAAFSWSPDGERLLWLDPEPEPGTFWYRWGIWDGASSFRTPRFVPSLLYVDEYVPFFEQYAQSSTLWSPDGSAFAYPGRAEDGAEGIWVQEVRPDRSPVLVADGEYVAWSPA
jgi:TolB protein